MKSVLVALVTVFVASMAFAKDMYHPSADNQMKAANIFSLRVPWIKNKGDKYDVRLILHNENPEKGIIVFLSDLTCKRGNIAGMLKHTFFNTGEKVIDFKPNETKEMTLVCRTEGAENGDFKLNLSKVYENPSLDGKTVGKVIAKDLSWSQSDRKE